jgi:branched-chain amino acid aminotransferase
MFRLNGAEISGLAPFDLADRGLTLGDGLFETTAVFGGEPALLGRHLDRMMAAAGEMRLPLDRAMLEAEVAALAGEGGDRVIRLTVTRGAGARGLVIPDGAAATVIASSSPYPKGALFAPIRLATVSVRRNHTSFTSRAKTLCYLDNVLAFDEAKRAGADDALMLGVSGSAACTSMANLFMVNGNSLVTPPVSEGVLPGIIRALVLELSAGLGLTPEERPIAPDELTKADAVLATNSVRLVMPVTAIDGQATQSDSRVQQIAAAVAKACGAPTI